MAHKDLELKKCGINRMFPDFGFDNPNAPNNLFKMYYFKDSLFIFSVYKSTFYFIVALICMQSCSMVSLMVSILALSPTGIYPTGITILHFLKHRLQSHKQKFVVLT